MALRLRRGTNAQRQTLTPVDGELIYTTDTKVLYVGDGTTIGGNSVSAPVTSVNGRIGTVSLTTNEISEGNGNLYFTDERAQDATASMLTGGTHTGIGFTYVDNGTSAGTVNAALNDSYVTELAQDAVKTLLDNGTSSNITYTYNDSSNSLSLFADVDSFSVIYADPQVFINEFTRGSGYTRHPTVTLSRGIGDTTGAFTNGLICAHLTPNALESIEIFNGGSGYLAAPTITIVPDQYDIAAVTATATCTVSNGAINSVRVTYEGRYGRTPTIVVTPTNGGSGAVLRASLYPTNIARITIETPGVDWTVAPIVNITTAPGDSPSVEATAQAALNRVLSAASPTESLTFVAGSDRVQVLTSETLNKKKVTIDARNVGEVTGAISSSLAFYGSTGNVLVGSRGLNWVEPSGALLIGSEVQNVDGSLRIVRNSFSSTISAISNEQYHATAGVVPVGFARARGTQTTPLAVQNQDRTGQIAFGGHDGTRFVYGGLIQSRVESTFTANSGKIPQNLEFFTFDGITSGPTRALTLAGLDKIATFNGPIHIHRLTTTQRDALTGLGANTVGYMIYNTTVNKFQGYQNTGGTTLEWVDLS